MLIPEDLKLKETDLEMAYLKMTLAASKRSGQTVDPRLESEVNMAQVQQTQSFHRSAGDMDVAFMNGAVEECVAAEGEVVLEAAPNSTNASDLLRHLQNRGRRRS